MYEYQWKKYVLEVRCKCTSSIRKLLHSATLLCNARRQFSSDGCLIRCMHSARARRGACNHPRRHPRSTRAVHWFARSQVLSFFSPFSRIMTRLLSSFSTPYRGFPVPGARSSLRGAAWGTPRPICVLGPALLPRLRATRALLLRPPSSTTPATDGWMAICLGPRRHGVRPHVFCA